MTEKQESGFTPLSAASGDESPEREKHGLRLSGITSAGNARSP
jgi:hypothetical protein